MSEELLNVEDDSPVTPPTPPVTDPPPADPVADDPDEQMAVEIQGGKHVPLAALKTVREENKALRQQAQESETLRHRLAQAEGQIEGFRQVAQTLQRPQEPPREQRQDPRALAFAQKLDLYRAGPNGEAIPDVEKAASILGIVQEVAGHIADQRVLPMAQNRAREQSIANYNWALGVKDPQGRTIPREMINQIWQSMPIEASANPEIAKTLVFAAAGMDRFAQQPVVAPPAGPPILTENVGGNPRTKPQLSALESAVAAERGIDASKWAEHTKGFVKGRTAALED